MVSLAVLNISLLVACCRVVWTQGPMPAPALSIQRPPSGNKFELFSNVELICSPPSSAPYPIAVSFGRGNATQSAIFTSTIEASTKVKFTTVVIEANKGIYVCWYSGRRSGELSDISNPVNVLISPLPRPWLVVPPFIPIGGNYTVHCQTFSGLPNKTLSLYFRVLPVTKGKENFDHWGSVDLPDKYDRIILERKLVDATESFEFACRLEIKDINQNMYHSPLSNPLPAIAEEAPIRLVPENQGSKCLGQLVAQVRGSWGPVCDSGAADYRKNMAMGRVVCRELGCGTRWSVEKTQDIGVANYSLGSISCQGDELRLRDCAILTVHQVCPTGQGLAVVCSDALPTPQILVTGYGAVSRIRVSDEHSLEISCMFAAPWFGTRQVYVYLKHNSGSSVDTIYSRNLVSGETMTYTLPAPVKSGEYTCSVEERVVGVTIVVSKWPSVGLIVAGVFACLIGAAILGTMCFCAKKA
ncbi:hypothetical protein DPEC_G00196420 [Dallia pectoralis]|uniref:Uncharacterized protein n=1 Tax=Dallia pectoralis TaxID=75939 RepID=A0ACC2G7U8_DALPE|nr:hypothetical protein DPEC_G00196420 [Dallia pectoralis]